MKIKKKTTPQTEAQFIEAEKRRNFKPDEGHRFPITRRELLAAGLVQGFSTLFLPTVASLIPRAAYAQSTGKIANAPAYLEIHAAGGAALMSQIAMKDQKRAFLPSYDLLGIGSAAHVRNNLAVDLFSNKATFIRTSGLYKGLTTTLSSNTDIFNHAAFLSVASQSGSDTVSNPLSATGLVQAAINQGSYLPNIRNARTINVSAVVNSPAPVVAEQFSNLLDVLQPRATDTFAGLPSASQSTLMDIVAGLNEKQAPRYAGWNNGDALRGNSETAMSTISNILKNRATLTVDPIKNPQMSTIWNLTNPKDPNYQRNYLEAGIVFNLAQGHATSAGILRPGYDYHKSDAVEANRIATDAADEALGALIGRVLLSFKAMNKPVFIYLTSDGSCTAKELSENKHVWVSDSNLMAANMIIAYRPGTGVSVSAVAGGAAPETQIGHYTINQIADKAHLAGDARGSALASFVNYLNFCGVNGAAHAKTLRSKNGEPLIDNSTDLASISKILR